MKTTLSFFYNISSNWKAFCLIFLVFIFSKIFVQGQQMLPEGYDFKHCAYKGIKVTSPESNITTFKTSGVKFEVPGGWKSVISDSAYYNFFKDDIKTILCNDNGSQVWLWCDKSQPATFTTEQMMEEDLAQFAPLHKLMKIILIQSPRSQDFTLYVWKAYHIHKGKKEAFTVFTGFKPAPTLKPNTGIVRLFGRSSTLDTEGKTEDNIIKMAEHIQTIGEGTKTKIDEKTLHDKMLKNIMQAIREGQPVYDSTIVISKTEWKFQTDPKWSIVLKKAKESLVSWKVPSPAIITNRIADARMVSPQHLFVTFTNGLIEMINTHTRNLLWYHEPIYKNCENCVIATGDEKKVICCYEISDSSYLKTFETESGNEQWSASLNGSAPLSWLNNEKSGILIDVLQEKNETHLLGLDIKSGKKCWEVTRKQNTGLNNPPFPELVDDIIITFFDGIEAISSDDGATIWIDNKLKLDDNCPLPKIIMDTVIVLDNSNKLSWLDVKTGRIIQNVKMRSSAEYSNISPSHGRIYLRGRIKNHDESQPYFIDAIKDRGGETLWTYSDSVLTVSNLIDDEHLVYVANWKGPIALDRNSGVPLYLKEVTEVGRNYPVSIEEYGDTIIYIGEMVIAGIDRSSGTLLFSQAFDPVSQTQNLDAIDQQCQTIAPYLKTYGKAGTEGMTMGFSSSDYSFSLARASQERSTNLSNQSARSYSSYRSGGSRSEYYKSEISGMQSRIEVSFSKAEARIGMMLWGLENASARAAAYTEIERNRLRAFMNSRNELLVLYKKQKQVGDYLTKITGEGDAIGVTVMHLPTGKVTGIIHGLTKDQIVILNPEQNELYYHDLRIVPEIKKNSDNGSGNEAFYGTYLVAVSLGK